MIVSVLKNRLAIWNGIFHDGPAWINGDRVRRFLPKTPYKSPTIAIALWIYGWYLRKFTVPGRLLLLVGGMIMVYSVTLFRTPIRYIMISLAGLVFCDFITGAMFRPRIKINRQTPERIKAGAPARIKYIIENLSRFPVFWLSLDNIQTPSGFSFANGPAAIDYIPGRGKVELTTEIIADQRGELLLPRPIADSTFPFGLFKWAKSGGGRDTVIVHPAYEPLDSLSLPVGIKFQNLEAAILSHVGESMDFHSCREFRDGDDPRHIHWPSTAKTGEIVVKEYQEEYVSRVALILDTRQPSRPFWRSFLWPGGDKEAKNNFDAAVSLTAAIAECLARRDLVVDIFAAGDAVFHLKTGRGQSNFNHILDILAMLKPEAGKSLTDLKPTVMAEVGEIGAAVAVLLDDSETSRSFIDELSGYAVAVKTILIGDGADSMVGTVIPPAMVAKGGLKI